MIGKELGRYLIVEALGEGGMAAVYKGFDRRLNRDVAIKVILPGFSHSGAFLKRFEREARSIAQLTHTNIVGVIDYGSEEGIPYLVMEFIPGGTLKDQLGKPLPWRQAAQKLIPVARALEYAHQKGIIHRDIKPANFLVTQSGDLMVSDFGIAKTLDTDDVTKLTGTGVGIGTPAYMAPEQGLGKQIDPRVDIYSLGVVFYEMITGRIPFQADTPLAVMLKHVSDPLPRPRSFVPDLPEEVEKVLFQALAKDPDERYQDMGEFAKALEKLAHRQEPKIAPVPLEKTQLPVIEKTELPVLEKREEEQPSEKISLETIEAEPQTDRKPIFRSPKVWRLGIIGVVVIGVLSTILISLIQRDHQKTVSTPTHSISQEDSVLTTQPPTQRISATKTPAAASSTVITDSFTVPPTPTTQDENSGLLFLVEENTWTGSDHINHLVWSPDSEFLAGASYEYSTQEEGYLYVWNIPSGDLIWKKPAPRGYLSEMTWSPDGNYIAAEMRNGSIRIYNAADGSSPATLWGHSNGVEVLIWSQDSQFLISGGYDSTIRVWDTKEWKEITVLDYHTKAITDIAFSPSGNLLASAGDDSELLIWDTSDWELLEVLQDHTEGIKDIAWSPDGLYLASLDNTITKIWTTENWEVIQSIPNDGGMRLAWSSENRFFAILDSNGLGIWETNDWIKIHVLDTDLFDWSPTTNSLITDAKTGEGDAFLNVWNVPNWDSVQLLEGFTFDIESINWSPNGTYLAALSMMREYLGEGKSEGFYEIRVWNVEKKSSLGSANSEYLLPSITDNFGVPMSLIPAGSFEMGSEDEDGDEKPIHTVTLNDFYIDQYEVTNSQYAECARDGVCNAPSNTNSDTRSRYYGNPTYADFPVIYVNWFDAQTYCRWRGGRLPTEAEWEKAARGGLVGNLYPWGNESPDCSSVNFGGCIGDTSAVGSYAQNGFGLYDMSGNVWEWVTDNWGSYPTEPVDNPLGPETGNLRVLRGGAWDLNANRIRAAFRTNSSPGGSNLNVGFRCVRDVHSRPLTDSPTTSISTPLPEGWNLVPDVIGLDQSAAAQRLKDSGFGVSASNVYTDGVEVGIVFHQEPASNSALAPGEKVEIQVATNKMILLDQYYTHGVGENQKSFTAQLPADAVCSFNVWPHVSMDGFGFKLIGPSGAILSDKPSTSYIQWPSYKPPLAGIYTIQINILKWADDITNQYWINISCTPQ